MIQKQSYLKVADNSGAKKIQCFHIVGSTGKTRAGLGDLIICAVKEANSDGIVKKGDIVRAVVVRTRKEYRRVDGSYIRFGENAAIIVKNDLSLKEMIATRVFGPIARELRDKGFSGIVSKAPEVV